MNEEGTTPHQPEPAAGGGGTDPALAAEISRRVAAILDAVEREASRLREEARAEAARYLDDARREADALVAGRRRQIAALSDELVAKSEAVVSRLDDAAPVRAGFEHLVRALGDAAERLSHETDPEVAAAEPGPGPVGPRFRPATGQAPFASTATPPAAGRFEEQPHPARAASTSGYGGFYGRSPATAPAPGSAPGSTPREPDDARMAAIEMAAAGHTRAEVRDHLHRVLGVVDPDRTLDEIFGPGNSEQERVPWTGRRG